MKDGYDLGQMMYRNRQLGGIEFEETRLSGERTQKTRLRSRPDKRLMDMVENEGHMEAFEQIKAAYDLVTQEIRTSSMKFGNGGKALRPDDHGKALQVMYRQWQEDCKRLYLSPMPALDVIAHGYSLNAADDKYRFRHGNAKKNLINCLEVWVKIPRAHNEGEAK